MTEEEAIQKMNKEKDEIRKSFFHYVTMTQRYKPEDLKHTGHKTVNDAIMYGLADAQRRIKKLDDDFFMEFPDWG